MNFLLILISALYLLFLIIFCTVWKKMIKGSFLQDHRPQNFISVVVPVRNESANVASVIDDLLSQNFPKDLYEIIVVDDHSEDSTGEIVQQLIDNGTGGLRLIRLSDKSPEGSASLTGKKQALKIGIQEAKGDIIATTDGDCAMGTNWLKSIGSYFENKAATMVVGPVTFHHENTAFEHMQSLEFAALVGVGAVTLKLGVPTMCNGANLAFTKKAFEEVGGYNDNINIPSGDDEFLLQKISTTFPQQVFFNTFQEGLVYTKPAREARVFLNQRVRWSGKWKKHKAAAMKVFPAFIFTYHLSLFVLLVATLLSAVDPNIFLLLIGAKMILEYVFIKNVMRHYGKPLYFQYFVILQSLYSFYVILFGVLANFGSFDWKGRRY